MAILSGAMVAEQNEENVNIAPQRRAANFFMGVNRY